MQITYEHTTIDKAFHKTQTIPKKFLELMSSTTAALGPVELILSERGQIKRVANLSKIRENMTVSFEKMVKTLDETGASQKDRKVFRSSLNIVKSATDDRLTALIEASLVDYLRIYYEDYPLKQDQAVEIPLNLGFGTLPLQTMYQINTDQGSDNAIIRVTQKANKDGIKVTVTTEIKTNLALGVISALKEERSMMSDNGNKFVQVTTLEPQ
jgi:DNA-binding phage protein